MGEEIEMFEIQPFPGEFDVNRTKFYKLQPGESDPGDFYWTLIDYETWDYWDSLTYFAQDSGNPRPWWQKKTTSGDAVSSHTNILRLPPELPLVQPRRYNFSLNPVESGYGSYVNTPVNLLPVEIKPMIGWLEWSVTWCPASKARPEKNTLFRRRRAPRLLMTM
ncbi:MAG: hypothetical protein HC904_04510 [Blastochloris sp.]|nr:hypothetical protein [Blastochloris sp.]